MTSSSSSDYDSECCHSVSSYEPITRSTDRPAFYYNIGHPLVYYAEVQQHSNAIRKQRSRESKKNPNCFVKAFRWYTQERCGSHRATRPTPASINPDIASFAAWLDSKYEQFVRDHDRGQPFPTHPRNSLANIKKHDTTNYEPCGPCATKKYKCVRSPWKKRRLPRNHKDGGDVTAQSNKSLEYILPPKDLSRPVSECCRPIPIPCCSNNTINTIIKSNSTTSVSPDRECDRPPDAVTTQEGSGTKPVSRQTSKGERKQKTKYQDFLCECIKEKSKIDAQSQYDSAVTESKGEIPCPAVNCFQTPQLFKEDPATSQVVKHNVVSSDTQKETRSRNSENVEKLCMNCHCHTYYESDVLCCDNRIEPSEQPLHEQDQIEFKPNSQLKISKCSLPNCQKTTQKQPVYLIREVEYSYTVVRNLPPPPKTKRYVPISVNDTAQTSDHSIRLGEDTHRGYPLFMKVVCADKLYEEL